MSHKAKVTYEKLAQGLPSFEAVNDLLDIENLDEEKMSIKAICAKAKEKIEEHTHLLETILQPDNSFTSLTEASAFTDEGKKEVLETLRKLMQLDRKLMAASINATYEEQLLHTIMQTYDGLKGKLLDIIKQLEECWNHKEEQQIQERYFG